MALCWLCPLQEAVPARVVSYGVERMRGRRRVVIGSTALSGARPVPLECGEETLEVRRLDRVQQEMTCPRVGCAA